MPDIQQVNPSVTVATGNFGVIGAPNAHTALSDASDATTVVFPSDGANLFVSGIHTLPDVDHRRHRIRIFQRSKRPEPESAVVTWRMRQPSASNPIDFSLNPLEDVLTDGVSAWFFPGSAPFPDFADSDPLTLLMIARRTSGAQACQTAKVYVEIDSRHQPTFDSAIHDRAGVDRSGGVVSDTNQPRVILDNYDLDDLPLRGCNIEVYAGLSPIPTGTVPIQQMETVGSFLADPFLLDPLPNGVYTLFASVASLIAGGNAFVSAVHEISFEVDFAPPQTPVVTPTVDACSEVAGPNVLVCWEVPEPESGEEFFDDILVVDIRRTDCNGTRLIHSEPVTQQEVS